MARTKQTPNKSNRAKPRKKKFTLADFYDESTDKILFENIPEGANMSARTTRGDRAFGEFTYQDGRPYFLSNTREFCGSQPKDKKGFIYSWILSLTIDENLEANSTIIEQVAGVNFPEIRTLPINKSFIAHIRKGSVAVNCQTFTNEKIRELAKLLID